MLKLSCAPFCLSVLMGLGLGQTGCSYLFVNGPPDNHKQMDYFDCTTGNGWPVFDAIYGTLNTAANIAMASRGDAQQSTYIIGSVGSALLWGSSSIVGFGRTSRCREARAQADQRRLYLQQRFYQQQQYYPQQPQPYAPMPPPGYAPPPAGHAWPPQQPLPPQPAPAPAQPAPSPAP